MNVLVNLSGEKERRLEKYRPKAIGGEAPEWTSVVEGFGSQSIYHSGYCANFVSLSKEGYWLLDQCSRNGCLDGETKEDVEEGLLNDDQLQAIHDFGSLKKAQKREYNMICAVWLDPPEAQSAEDAGRQLYEEFVEQGGNEAEE
jgi:hypothetical protein